VSASDAVILLVADGLVAVGRVLGGLRRLSGAEVRARQVGEADRLAEVEAAEEVWAPHDPFLNCCTFHEPAYFDAEPDPPVRSAAVTVPAADKTTQADHLEAAWHYHTGAVGYAAMRTGGVEWFCEGCDWSGPTKQAHARHRFQVLADMKNATTRVEQQLSNPCVVDDCDFSWHTYEELNAHSRQMHLEPNPFPDGGFRYPGADDVGDFTWHHATTRVQEQLGGTA